MISDKVTVSDRGNECEGIEAALNLVEKTARYLGFYEKDIRSLRLLAEEMIAGSASILALFTGSMWAQTEGDAFQIVLEMDGLFSQAERERLIALTRDSRNEAPKGFFAKLSMAIGNVLSGEGFFPGSQGGADDGDELLWNAMQVQEQIEAVERQASRTAELVDIEKKILSGLADDVTVSARPSRVRITVTRKMAKMERPA